MSQNCGWGEDAMNELADVLAELDDPRAVNPRRHSLHNILAIALCAGVGGGQTCADMELYGHAKRDLLQSCHIVLSLDLRNSENI